MSAKVEGFTRGFFWFGYAVFLAASIPHIAAYFRHFDPVTSNVAVDAGYWTIAVLLAVVIDVSDVLVSLAVMKAQANGAKFGDVYGYWLFILLIMTLSWFFNWQYNVVFGTNEFHAVDQNVIWGSLTVGQVNPIIGSAFQLLLLVYTGMAHKFAQKPKVISVEELEKEAKDAERRAVYQARIDAVKKAQRAKNRQDFFEALKQTKEGVTAFVKGEDEQTLDEVDTEVSPVHEGEYDGSINQSDSEEYRESQPINEQGIEQGKSGVSDRLRVPRTGSRSKVYVTLEEAAELLQYDLSYVKTLRTKDELRTSGKNRDLISMASIKEVLSKKQTAMKKQSKSPTIEQSSERDTEKLDRVEGEDKVDITLAILRENPDVTDEELRVQLGLRTVEIARFWKVKAQSILEEEQSVEQSMKEEVLV